MALNMKTIIEVPFGAPEHGQKIVLESPGRCTDKHVFLRVHEMNAVTGDVEVILEMDLTMDTLLPLAEAIGTIHAKQ